MDTGGEDLVGGHHSTPLIACNTNTNSPYLGSSYCTAESAIEEASSMLSVAAVLGLAVRSPRMATSSRKTSFLVIDHSICV